MYIITPLILFSIKSKFFLYIPALLFFCLHFLASFFKFLLDITPNIIVDHPIIFIIMTISNIILLYIVYLSIFDKNRNLRENIIYLFNSLKECKFCPFKIKLLLKNIVIYLKERIYLKFKQLKDNLLSILLTLIIIIVIANVFRQPIFICLGEDIFRNFPLYMYVMFSSILPTIYIVTILIKWLRTRNLDFSFRLTDLKDKITILSLSFLTISLYISYFYIWPLIGFSIIYFIQSKPIFIDLILNFKNIQGLRPSILTFLPGLSVTEVFRHFGCSYTKDEILPTIENYEPATTDANPSNELTKYSHNKWISKLTFTDNIEANAEYSRKNIKTPYLPTELFKSYWNNFGIKGELVWNDTFDKNIPINIALYYLKGENNYYHCFGGPEGLFDLQTYCRTKHSTMFAQSNKPLSEILKQICMYFSDNTRNIYNPYETSPFIVICHKKRITFAMYKPSQALEQNYPFKKGHFFQKLGDPKIHIDTPNMCGIIGLVATTWGVETIPHQNIYKPQLAFYDISKEKHVFSIHMIFKYLSLNRKFPSIDDNFIQTNNGEIDPINLTEQFHGKDDLNIKLEQNGRLIREI